MLRENAKKSKATYELLTWALMDEKRSLFSIAVESPVSGALNSVCKRLFPLSLPEKASKAFLASLRASKKNSKIQHPNLSQNPRQLCYCMT